VPESAWKNSALTFSGQCCTEAEGDIDITDPAKLAIILVREQAPETRLLPIAARPVAGHPEYQQVNRVDRDGAALKGGWTFLVNTTTRAVVRTVGDPDELDFETAMARAMPAYHRR
jgi:hypothetical protein